MGGDNLAGFHRWRHWRTIQETMPVAVLDRPGWRHRALASQAAAAYRAAQVPEGAARTLPLLDPPAWVFLSIPLSNLSSTVLRARQRHLLQARPSGPATLSM
jgi:nicotinate-nucleotide adenylyltransferase